MEYILDERSYAEKMLDTGDIGNNVFSSLCLLAKYYYHVHNMKKADIICELDKIMSAVYDGYTKESWIKFFEKAIRNAKKYGIIKIDSIPVTKSEFDSINRLQYSAERKLAFTLLVIAKYMNICRENNNDWVSCEPSKVFKMANVSMSRVDQAKMYATLTRAGIITYSNKTGSVSARVLIIDNDGESVFDVDDMKNLGGAYLMSQGGRYDKCISCGIVFKQDRSGRKKYCNGCLNKDASYRFKRLKCIDCGADIVVASNSKRVIRCEACTKSALRVSVRNAVRRSRNSM